MIAALLCSNHITYRFGKGLTPKQYRLDVSTMAVIMDEYARSILFLFFSVVIGRLLILSQIAAQYGNEAAAKALQRSSSYALLTDPYEKDSYASSTGANPALTSVQSRTNSTTTTGYNSHSQNSLRPQSGVALFDRNRDSYVGTPTSALSPSYSQGQGQGHGQGYMDYDDNSRYGTTGSGSEGDRERQHHAQSHGWAQ